MDIYSVWVGIAQSVQRLATDWTVRESNLVGGRDFPHPSRPALGPPQSALCTMGTGSFPGVKQPGRGFDHPLSSSAEVKERVELYVFSPFRSWWPVPG